MNKILQLTILILLASSHLSIARMLQIKPDTTQNPSATEKPRFAVEEWRRLFNQAFGSVLGSVGPNNDVGNYASFDPLDGSFKFKGVVPIGKEEKSISYLSLAVQGGITSSDFNKIFDGFKIGTNSAVQVEYHFKRRVKTNAVTRESEAEAVYNREKHLLCKQEKLELDFLDQQKEKSTARLTIVENLINSANLETGPVRQRLLMSLSYLEQLRTTVEDQKNPKHDSTLKEYREAIKKSSTYASEQDSLKKTILTLNREADSLRANLNDWRDIKAYIRNSIYAKNDAKLDTLQNNYKFSKFTINWFTLIGSIGKKSYYTFNSSAPFNEQIKDDALYSNSFGIAWSMYTRNDTEKRSSLLNIGILRKRDGNTDTLTTTDVNQERTITNEQGDVVKKISKKYSSYTDLVEASRIMQLYINYFYIFGKRQSSFHVFPSYSKIEKKTGMLNFGLGYIISFKNRQKDNPVINTELYILNSDLFNSRNSNRNFKERCEVGLKFSLPFNLF